MRPQLRRELSGIGLVLVAVFVAGTLLLQGLPDEGSCLAARGWFGPVGGCVKWSLGALIGLPSAWLIPLAALVHGLRLLGRLESGTDRSWMIFLVGLAALLPIGIGLAAGGSPDSASVAGLWGSFFAFYLRRVFGSAGAWILEALLVSTLMAWTLRWNPIRAIIGPGPVWRRRVRQEAPTLSQQLEPAPEEMPAVEAGAEGPVAADDVARADAPRKPRTRRTAEPAAGNASTDAPDAARPAVPPGGSIEDEIPPASLLTRSPCHS